MKTFMSIVNFLAITVSLMCVCAYLVTCQFGMAWLMVLPLVYSIFNFIAIESDGKRKD